VLEPVQVLLEIIVQARREARALEELGHFPDAVAELFVVDPMSLLAFAGAVVGCHAVGAYPEDELLGLVRGLVALCATGGCVDFNIIGV
jgi:hypothetical protein